MDFLGLDRNTLRGILLILLMLGFFGVVAWAWSGKRKQTFREASRLPLEEDDGRVPGADDRREREE